MLHSCHALGSPILFQNLTIRKSVTTHRAVRSNSRRADVICFSNVVDDVVRPPWHTLPVKHVIESQQFDKVPEYSRTF